jgi:hypothetical protein
VCARVRPPELRHTGANQTIAQPGIFAGAVRFAVDVGVAEDRPGSVPYWRATVSRAVAEAGGQCAICGYERHPAALQFHHGDPDTKAFGLSHKGVTVGLERARAEAGKCVLLCANCHAEVEAGVTCVPLQLVGEQGPRSNARQ